VRRAWRRGGAAGRTISRVTLAATLIVFFEIIMVKIHDLYTHRLNISLSSSDVPR
jgi:hypothetical protein